MNVRHKRLGLEFGVKPLRDDVLINDGHYYETLGGSFIAHQDSEYEVVKPPETWVDVTEQIEAEGQRIKFIYPDAYTVVPNNYRLRKVQFKQYNPVQTADWKPEKDYRDVWVFIVERRTS